MRRLFVLLLERARRRRLGMRAVAVVILCSGCRLFETLFASSSDDDHVIWSVKGHSNFGQPFVDDSTVYFLGNQHQVTAVDKVRGRVRWVITLPVSREFTFGTGGVSLPGRVIVGDQDLFALDSRDGSITWTFVPFPGANAGRGIPAPLGDVVIAGSSSGNVYAVEWATGRQRWATRLVPRSLVIVYQPRVADGKAYVSFRDNELSPNGEPRGGVAALDAATGAVLWLTYLPHNVDPAGPTGTFEPVITENLVVVAADDGPIYAYDRQSGAQVWKAPALLTPGATGPETIRDTRALATGGGLIFTSSNAKVVMALDPTDGRQRWVTPTPLGGGALFLFSDDRSVFLCQPGGQFEVFNASDGKRRWAITDRSSCRMGPGIDGNRLFIGSSNELFALRND